MLTYERKCWQKGYLHIGGVDEVGRGCLYGAVVAACVVLPPDSILDGVADSKKLSTKKREELYTRIMEEALSVGIGQVEAEEIDQINIKQASRLAMKKAIQSMSLAPDYLLIDAEQVDLPVPQLSIIHGDALSQSIAAASIVAKVTRDRWCMKEWDKRDPGYGIAQHKGYATRLHRWLIQQHGPSPNHRQTFLRRLATREMKGELGDD